MSARKLVFLTLFSLDHPHRWITDQKRWVGGLDFWINNALNNGLKEFNWESQGYTPTVSFPGFGYRIAASVTPDTENAGCHVSALERSQTF